MASPPEISGSVTLSNIAMLLGSMQAFLYFVPLYRFGYGGVMTGVLITVRALTPQSHRASATGINLSFAWMGHALGG